MAGKLRVLVVEDNPDAADSLRMVLNLAGHEAQVARDGPGGLQAARAWLPDVVLCDLGLPGFSGFEVADRLKADPATTGLRLIAISGYADGESQQKALACGFEMLFAKPADVDRLLGVLAQKTL